LTRDRVERRLAAVLAADVAGYSRLMGADEEGTLARLKTIRKSLVDPTIADHRGRIVKTTGDGLLVEFASAVDAARCAVEAQRGMAKQNAIVPQNARIEFRIGIHVGDIIIDENDIFGDGVNIAARLEGIAEPGGVCLSDDAYRQIRGKIEIACEDLGQQTLKNIAEPMRAWRIKLENQVVSLTAQPGSPVSQAPALALPEKPSIAVLPFQNMSADPEQEYFADGMVEDIITALSRFKSLFVIARNSSFTYKGKAVDVKQVGRELGVRYVLEGSVRKAGNRVRITGQLVEAATNRHLWADKFDGALEDVFGLQDQVTSSVVGLIAPRLEEAEIERAKQKPTGSLHSYDFYLRGVALLNKRSLPEALEMFRSAIKEDREYAAAYAMAAWTFLSRQAIGGFLLTPELRNEALEFANAASKQAGDDAFALARSGHVLTYLGREWDRGASMVEEAVSINPNLAVAWYSRGWVSVMCGEAERAIESFDRMLRLSPLDPLRGRAWNGMSFALFFLRHHEEGMALATRSIQIIPDVMSLAAYIVNAVPAGCVTEARAAVAQLLALQPDFQVADAEEAFPVRLSDLRERMAISLQAAGVPE